MTDRAKLLQLDSLNRNQLDLIQKQRNMSALMIRTCVIRLQSPDSRKRKEAINALTDLADMLEGKTK